MGRKNKPRLIPEQDQRICGSICLCQLTIVLSCVSMVYLSVAVYSPAMKAFKSGFESEPVLCQAVNTSMDKDCSWYSCGEWCLTKTSGLCAQMHATVRRNGSDIILNNCSRIVTTPCDEVHEETLESLNCNWGNNTCINFLGVYNCSKGWCKNMSILYNCYHEPDGIIIVPEKNNEKLYGFFECNGHTCQKITKYFKCDRKCGKITTNRINVLLQEGNSLITAECQSGYSLTESRGSEIGIQIPPTQIWEESTGILLTSCMTVTKDGDKISATDCINGTILAEDVLPQSYMTFPQLWQIVLDSDKVLDPTHKYLPNQHTLTIYNTSRVQINLDACVNTLRGECDWFKATHGVDGDNNTAQSRFLCYYNKNSSDFVIARFDLDRTFFELIIAAVVPAFLFVVSFISLCVITKSVKVGDDAKMRCKYCVNENSDLEDTFIDTMHEQIHRTQSEEDRIMETEGISIPVPERIHMLSSNNELSASTKSLIPLSPCTETTEKTFSGANKSTNSENNEKPLVVL